MAESRKRDGVSARALEFCILTATRTNETLGARWSEFDLVEGLWVVPAERMKAGRELRVPLNGGALAILEKLATVRGDSAYVFSARPGRPLARIALLNVLHRMGREGVAVHGFRSSFRDWAGDQTGFPREVIEAALAHVVGDKAEQAYRRATPSNGDARSWRNGPRIAISHPRGQGRVVRAKLMATPRRAASEAGRPRRRRTTQPRKVEAGRQNLYRNIGSGFRLRRSMRRKDARGSVRGQHRRDSSRPRSASQRRSIMIRPTRIIVSWRRSMSRYRSSNSSSTRTSCGSSRPNSQRPRPTAFGCETSARRSSFEITFGQHEKEAAMIAALGKANAAGEEHWARQVLLPWI